MHETRQRSRSWPSECVARGAIPLTRPEFSLRRIAAPSETTDCHLRLLKQPGPVRLRSLP